MRLLRHALAIALVLVVVWAALFVGTGRGDLYKACSLSGDAEGGTVHWLILCAWVTPMVLVAYLFGAVMNRPYRS